MNVIKRDGQKEVFDENKIINSIKKAFKACGYNISENILNSIIADIRVWEDIEIEDIQDEIEEILMDYNYPTVAKEYILYRERRKQLRNMVNKKLNFIDNYINSDNTANATIDDNSNVANRNIAVLNSEIHKEDNREVNLKMLRDMIKNLYPDFNYKQMDKDFNSIAYLHDSSSQIGMPYCVAITMYPFLLNGIKDLGGLSAEIGRAHV